MNIMFVTPFFMKKEQTNLNSYKGISGMPVYIFRTAKALRELGHKPIIVCGGNEELIEKYEGVPIYRTCTVVGRSNNNSVIEMIKSGIVGNYLLQRKVNAICKKRKIDIIQYAGNNGTGVFHHLRVPAVMRVSSYFKLFFSDYMSFSKGEVWVHSLVEKMALKRMNEIYCPSHVLADYLEQELHKHIDVIETPFFDETNEKDNTIYDAELKYKKYILYYGVFSPRKGVFLIADIAKRILDEYPDYFLVFVGDDRMARGKSTLRIMKQKMQMADKTRIIYLKELSHIYLYPIIQNASIVLNPSYMENLSNACVEAMAFGKIVIGTNGASFEQLINDGENGFLAEIGNSESLLSCIHRALNLPEEERRRVEESARRRIEELRPERTIKQLLQYYSEVISRRGEK